MADDGGLTCSRCGGSFPLDTLSIAGNAPGDGSLLWACVETIDCAERCAVKRRAREAAAPALAEVGEATRFAKGNQAALMHGRGRPRKNVSKLMDTLSIRTLRGMAKIAFDKAHPWHDEHGFQAMRDLMKAVVPKRREITGKDGERLTIADVHSLVFQTPGGPGEDDDE